MVKNSEGNKKYKITAVHFKTQSKYFGHHFSHQQSPTEY